MRNWNFIVLFTLSLVLIAGCNRQKNVETLKYEFTVVGYPSKYNNSGNRFIDTIEFIGSYDEEDSFENTTRLFKKFHNTKAIEYERNDLRFEEKLNKKIGIYNFGKLLFNFRSYIHSDFGLIYCSRTDWDIEEYVLIEHPDLTREKITFLVDLCKSDFKRKKEELLKTPLDVKGETGDSVR